MSDLDRLTRPIVGIENRTAQEAFDIMCDRLRVAALSGTREAVEPVGLLDPKDDEAMDWVSSNLSGLRHDGGSISYTLTAVVRAFQAGKAFAIAAPPSDPVGQGVVTVKPLEWEHVTDQIPKHAYAAYTPFSRWLIVVEFVAMNEAVYRLHEVDYLSLEEAKAAAQADYERRILSALSPAPEAGSGDPIAVLSFDRSTPGNENEMPRVLSCNWLPDGQYSVYLRPSPEAGSDEVERLRADLAEAIRRGEDQWTGWVKETAALRAAEARETALRDQLGKMREALDLERAVHDAAHTWCGEKDRETFNDDVLYFCNNWSALNGLRAYVEREITRRVLALRTTLAETQEAG